MNVDKLIDLSSECLSQATPEDLHTNVLSKLNLKDKCDTILLMANVSANYLESMKARIVSNEKELNEFDIIMKTIAAMGIIAGDIKDNNNKGEQ